MWLECGQNYGIHPLKFLGILVGVNPRRVATWKLVLDMLRNRLASWKRRNLSIGGRVILINSVLNSAPLYFFLFLQDSEGGD